jgi:FAD/FMN-containing dehydrogenase
MVTAVFDKQQAYQQKKQSLSAQIKQKALQSNANITLKKDTSNLFRHRDYKTNRIDVRAFNGVIAIDKENLVAEVEGMTTYENLVAATLQFGCLPTVVPELKSITIGGALSGVGVESSSFRYGLVHETITQFDALLPDGRIIDCRADNENSDLFFAFPNSYGTLGYALKVTVRLVPAKKYIKLNYQHFSEANKFFQHLKDLCLTNRDHGDIAFVDGVVFDETHQVLITAEMTDHAPWVSNYQYMKIYYQAVKTKQQDYLTTADYIWRWDTDWFWCSKVFYLQNPLMRFLFGKWALKSTFYSKLMRFAKRNPIAQWLMRHFEKRKESVIQDVAIPIHHATEYLKFFQENIGIKPVWICPIHPLNSQTQYQLFKMQPDQLYVNFGFWDMVPSNKPAGYYNRLVERKVFELGGNKSLYSNVFYTAEEFWTIYDKNYYQSLKNKYDPANKLNSLYNKCVEKI